ncbi:MarR family winged helix-turn-helix transcriptional regulator [Streptomyces sp. NPDC054834]
MPPYSASDIAAAWRRERPGTPTESIEIVTPIRWLGKLFADDRGRALREAGIDAATLDLLSVIRRSGPPYALSTREIARRTLVTAGAISQRVARAERDGLVRRAPGAGGRRSVEVSLTVEGHASSSGPSTPCSAARPRSSQACPRRSATRSPGCWTS